MIKTLRYYMQHDPDIAYLIARAWAHAQRARVARAERRAWDSGAHRCYGPCDHPVHTGRRQRAP